MCVGSASRCLSLPNTSRFYIVYIYVRIEKKYRVVVYYLYRLPTPLPPVSSLSRLVRGKSFLFVSRTLASSAMAPKKNYNGGGRSYSSNYVAPAVALPERGPGKKKFFQRVVVVWGSRQDIRCCRHFSASGEPSAWGRVETAGAHKSKPVPSFVCRVFFFLRTPAFPTVQW